MTTYGLIEYVVRQRGSASAGVIEQHHRNGKSSTNVMFGFKRFSNAAIVIAGVELAHRVCKGQFDFAEPGFKETTASAVW